MLTRDGERVLEVLLVAAGFALTMVFHDEFPAPDRSVPTGPFASRPAVLQPVRTSIRQTLESDAEEAAAAIAGRIDRALTEAAARLTDFERPTGRC